VTSGSSVVALVPCAVLALLSGSAAAAIWTMLLSQQTGFHYPFDPDDDSGGDGGGPWPPRSPDGGAGFDWAMFERDFREYASRRAPADWPLERIRMTGQS
jgi:hypothetical protein